MLNKIKNSRLSVLYLFVLQFLILSFIVRLAFYIWSFAAIDFTVIGFLRTLLTGLFFDIGVISFFSVFYVLYLLLFPNKWIGNLFDKIVTYWFYFITTVIFT